MTAVESQVYERDALSISTNESETISVCRKTVVDDYNQKLVEQLRKFSLQDGYHDPYDQNALPVSPTSVKTVPLQR